jgi:type IX secretion system PorP/SprF family membrane protein
LKKLFTYLFLGFSLGVLAQHYQFSQFYAAQTYLNPAFTGATSCARLSMNYRNQWSAIPGEFTTFQASFDKPLKKLNSGVGFTFFQDRAGINALKSTQFMGMYAYELKITKRLVARMGLNAGFTQRGIDYSNLIFGDQVARNAATTVESLNYDKLLYFNTSAGYLMYGEGWWAGVAFNNLNRPNQSLTGEDSRLPIESKLHAGYKYKIDDESDKSKDQHAVSVAFNYKKSARFNQIDIGAYYTRSYLVFGLWYRGIPVFHKPYSWYRNNDAIVAVIGISGDRVQVGYSFDYTIGKLTLQSSGGTHELSMTYLLCGKKKGKKKKLIVVSCPKF